MENTICYRPFLVVNVKMVILITSITHFRIIVALLFFQSITKLIEQSRH